MRVLGRLRSGGPERSGNPERFGGGGIDARQAQTQIEASQSQIGKIYPTTDSGWRVRARPLAEEFSGNARVSLLVLLGAVAFIMLIACANVANLLLSRAVVREREFAIRATLGAGWARLLRQTLTESLLLCLLSASLALP